MDKILFDTVTISSVGLEGGVRRVCKISVARYLVAHRFEWCLTQRKLLRRERKSEQSIADTADISLGFCNVSNVYMYSSVDFFFLTLRNFTVILKCSLWLFGGGQGQISQLERRFCGGPGGRSWQ